MNVAKEEAFWSARERCVVRWSVKAREVAWPLPEPAPVKKAEPLRRGPMVIVMDH